MHPFLQGNLCAQQSPSQMPNKLHRKIAIHRKNSEETVTLWLRYEKLLSDAQQKTYRVLAAFETPDLDMAYDVAEGAPSMA